MVAALPTGIMVCAGGVFSSPPPSCAQLPPLSSVSSLRLASTTLRILPPPPPPLPLPPLNRTHQVPLLLMQHLCHLPHPQAGSHEVVSRGVLPWAGSAGTPLQHYLPPPPPHVAAAADHHLLCVQTQQKGPLRCCP